MNRSLHSMLALAGLLTAAVSSPAIAADAAVQKVTMRAVTYFDFDRDTLGPEEQATILAEVSKVKGVTWQTIKATGHTDSVGAPAYNDQLSQRRAAAVKAYLLANGINVEMIRTDAKASAAPAASNETDEGRAKNRRTEIEFQGVRAATP